MYEQMPPQMRAWHQRVQARPSWVWKLTLATALVVFVLPLVLLTLAALLVAAAVFTVLSLVAGGIGFIANLFGGLSRIGGPPADGRRNVRVMR
ncbi:MAG: hypothetical protein ACLFV3_10300 [Phycisphaeraceae bacterium]